MSLAKIFYLLKDAELHAGDLYELIGLSLALSDPGLADLFNDLAAEEKLHAREIDLMQGIILQCPDAFLETPEAERLIAEFLDNLDMIRAYYNQHHARMKPADLLHLALDIERHMVETHGRFFVSVGDEKAKALFRNLNAGNAAHIRRLEAYRPG